MNRIVGILSIIILLMSCNGTSKSSDENDNNDVVNENMTTYVFPETGISISLEDDYNFDETKNLLAIDGGLFISVPSFVDKSFEEITKGLEDFQFNPEYSQVNGVDVAIFSVPEDDRVTIFAFIDNGDNVVSIGGGSLKGKEDKIKKILLTTKCSK